MLDLYYWTTPNGNTVTMFLEEAEVAYRLVPATIGAGKQFKPEFPASRRTIASRRSSIFSTACSITGCGDRPFVAGETYTIADMACYPWIVPHERQGQSLDEFPNLKRWFQAIAERPGTQRAHARGAEVNTQLTVSEEAKKVLFGQTAATLRG